MLFLALAGCSSQLTETTLANSSLATNNPPSTQSDKSNNIARRILQLDAQVKPVTASMSQLLDDVMAEACAAIGKLPRSQDGRWDRAFAVAALKCIDAALIRRGFLYPDAGAVDLLADGLTPFQMSVTRRPSFEAQPHNKRRGAMIAQKFPGPFYALDCDTASFIYLGIAEEMKLPLHLVVIPAFNRKTAHAFLRWREGSHILDWETMDGAVATDDSYIKDWKISSAEVEAGSALADLSSDEVIGCEHYLLAVQYERRRSFEEALRELSLALTLYPQSLDARREFAWVTATSPNLPLRQNNEAIADALFVLRQVDDPDARDTLAAAYASAGKFDLAVQEEKAALLNTFRSPEAKPGYLHRLELYQQHAVYRQSETSEKNPDH
jgi:tetratricopeptide (TPR) repeat protein